MLISSFTRLVILYGLLLPLIWAASVMGQTQPNPPGQPSLDLQPIANVGIVYDDNIFLDRTVKESDLMGTASAGIRIRAQEERDNLDLSYSPTFVKYRSHTESDTVRHNAGLDLVKHLSPHLKFELNDSYLKTEEPIEPQREIFNVRRTRGTYWRNTARSNLGYQFGQWDIAAVGYDYEILENSDPAVTDSRRYGPSGSISYGFDIRNILTMKIDRYRYEYRDETASTNINDFDGFEGDVRYTHRFNPQNDIYANYSLSRRDFIDDLRDYLVHTGVLGCGVSLTRHTTLNLEIGYYVQDRKALENTKGLVFSGSVRRQFERGSVGLNARSGWDEYFLEAEPRGFSRTQSVGVSLDYRLLERLTSYADGSYWESEAPDGLKDSVYQGTLGLRFEFLQWYFASLEYVHRVRNSDLAENEYTNNRVMLSISAAWPFWGERESRGGEYGLE